MLACSPTKLVYWPMLRVRAGQSATVELLSGDWVRLVTHFFRQTFLCPEIDECGACSLLPQRCFWYLPALYLPSRRPTILELSASASADLEQCCRFAGSTVRAGCEVELSRKAAKGRLRVEVVGARQATTSVPLAEWLSPLMAIFKLPPLRAGESLVEFSLRVRSQIASRADLAAASMTAAAGNRPVGR